MRASFDVIQVVDEVEFSRPLVLVHFLEGVLEGNGSVDHGSNLRYIVAHISASWVVGLSGEGWVGVLE